MGRIRTVKPELFQHSVLFDAEVETSLPLRLAFIGMFTCCDKAGRFKWRPRELKLAVLPYDNCDFPRVLDALLTRGFLVKYASQGEVYGAIPTWTLHQFVNNREPESKFPEPQENEYLDASSTREAREANGTTGSVVKEGKGKEGNGKGKDTSLTTLEVPTWLPLEAWEAFVEHRKSFKPAMSRKAVLLTLRELDKFRHLGQDPGEVLNQSIRNGWKGVFELKNGGNNGNGKHATSAERNVESVKRAYEIVSLNPEPGTSGSVLDAGDTVGPKLERGAITRHSPIAKGLANGIVPGGTQQVG